MIVGVEAAIQDYSPATYESLLRVLKQMNFDIRLIKIRKKAKKKRAQYDDYPLLTSKNIKQFDLIVVFSPYATSHNALQLARENKVRILCLELGFLPKSILCDIGGFWAESRLMTEMPDKIKDHLENSDHQLWSKKYAEYLVNGNISKRPQPSKNDVIDRPFVFLPMQYMNDQSVIKFCSVSYPRFMQKVANFCKNHKLILAIKKHPHAYKKEPKQVDAAIKRINKASGGLVKVVDGSIHYFCQKCEFMACMNTGAISDGLANNAIMSHCGQSIFMNSGSVIHDDKINDGLERCLISKKEDFLKYQLATLYFLYNKYLLLEEDTHNSVMSNDEKIRNQLLER